MLVVISINLGGGGEYKIEKVDAHYPRKTDAVLLQETHMTDPKTKRITFILKRKWHILWSHGTTDSRGVAILLNKNTFPNPPTVVRKDSEGRWLWVTAEDNGGTKTTIGTVYAPAQTKERIKFLKELEMNIPKDCPAIVGGDWNTT